MGKWKNLKGIDLDVLRDNRRSLHQAVQLVGVVPRNLLPHDPTDGTASLEWNANLNSLEAIPVTNPVGLEVSIGLCIKSFSLYLSSTGTEVDSFDMKGKSTNEGLYWLKEKLEKLLFPIEDITLDLPYKIENYNSLRPLGASAKATKEYARLYANMNKVLYDLVRERKDAYDVRCWPHHFDLATLIPIKLDQAGEITESIGVGLSPGDDGINEPYIYVNVWPEIDVERLKKHKLPVGQWNSDGWSGAVLTYSQLLNEPDQKTSFVAFIDFAIQAIDTELK